MTQKDTGRLTEGNTAAPTAKLSNEHSTNERAYPNSLGGEYEGLAPSETHQSTIHGSVPMHVNHRQTSAYSTPSHTGTDTATHLADRCLRLLERMNETEGDIPEEVSREEDELENRLVDTPALTVVGIAAKMRTALSGDDDENAPGDMERALLWSAVHDLEAMAFALNLPLVPPFSLMARPE